MENQASDSVWLGKLGTGNLGYGNLCNPHDMVKKIRDGKIM